MRRHDKELTDKVIIQEILEKSTICTIALFDTEYPYVVSLNYGYKANALYFHCATKGKKIDLIKKNNNVGFKIVQFHNLIKADLSCDWTTAYRSIMGTGEIEIITDTECKLKGLDILMKQHGRAENTFKEKAVNKVLILKLNINKLTAKQSGKYD